MQVVSVFRRETRMLLVEQSMAEGTEKQRARKPNWKNKRSETD
ncbi:hypothetical protein P4V43_28875 [Brevibacillus fortis]|nr:hypothetical protein [Brevibacillus fortis]